MQSGRLPWPIVFVVALILPCGIAGPATADHISPDFSTFAGEFHAFLADFPRWDASHFDLPVLAWAMTPDQQRPAMLFLLMDLWMLDQQNTSLGALTPPPLFSLSQVPQPVVSGTPGTGDGGGTIASG